MNIRIVLEPHQQQAWRNYPQAPPQKRKEKKYEDYLYFQT